MRTGPDLRLAGLALGTWLAALAALYLPSGVALLVAGAAAAGVPLAALVTRGRGLPWGWAAVAVLLGVVCGATATAARTSVRDAEPLAGLARGRASVRAELVVRDDPRPAARAGGGRPTWLVVADLDRLRSPRELRLGARVVVLATDEGWRGLLPGQRVIASGRLLPPRDGDLRAGALSTSAPPETIGPAPWVQRAAGQLRAGLQRACAPLPDGPGGLLPGLVVGDTSRLDPAVADDFRATGMTHLVAVSGANVCYTWYFAGVRAVIYTRVSSDPNGTLRSVAEQETECRQVAERHGWTVTRVFADNDRSASRYAVKERPGYRDLRDHLNSGRADVLVLWEGSRAQRDLGDYLKLRDLCAQREIQYCYSGRVYDLTRTDDRFTTALDALLAEREADVTRDRIMRSVRGNAAKGRPHGKLLYGYRRTYDDRGVFTAQVIHDEQAAVVREAARRVSAGESCYAVAQSFNQRGIAAPRGGSWNLTQIRRLVTNPGYVSQRVHQGRVIGQADWPSVLDETTFAACVERMNDPRRKTVRDSAVKHLLSGAARCGVCGGPMRVQKNRGHFAYLCDQGFHVSVKTIEIESFVTKMVLARLVRPDALEVLAGPAHDSAAAARAEATGLRARLDGFYEQAALGKVSAEGLAKIETRLLPAIHAAEARAHTVSVPPLLSQAAGPDAATVWERLAVGQRREVVSLLVDLRVGPTMRGSRFDPRRLGESRWIGDDQNWGPQIEAFLRA